MTGATYCWSRGKKIAKGTVVCDSCAKGPEVRR